MMYEAAERKARGAYYTSDKAAAVIARWAVRPGDRVLDPSCGDGAFLRAAAEVGMAQQIIGVELGALQARETRAAMRGYQHVRVVCSDFFDYEDEPFDAIIGNPPFIRYQSFNGPSREKALFRCARAGVRLSRLASSWAPFVVCAGEMLATGGRLALLLPAEILHAGYAKPVLQYLNATFDSVTILTFQERIFPDLAQDVLLLLAAGKGSRCSELLHIEATTIETMGDPALRQSGSKMEPSQFLGGSKRIKEMLADADCMALINTLVEKGAAFRLGQRMTADIGYVTGANEFFHIEEREARRRRIPQRFLSPTVYRGASLSGLAYRVDDWHNGNQNGTSGYLLRIERESTLSPSLEKYLSEGISRGYNKRFKCRVRTPWYSVPHIYRPEAFLTSMSGDCPRIVVNEANVLAGNSLHILRSLTSRCNAHAIAASWLSSVTALSIEVEGHALGGGMLKLEPSEAERVAVIDLEGLISKRDFHRLDRLSRDGKTVEATEYVDRIVSDRYGISTRQLGECRRAAIALRRRRLRRR